MAKIQLTQDDVYKALVDHYGEADFVITFEENEPGWEKRNGRKFSSVPKAGLNDQEVVLFFDDEAFLLHPLDVGSQYPTISQNFRVVF